MKVQDTVPICPTQLSQVVALGAVHAGRAWVQERVEGLTEQKAAVMRALQPLGKWGEGVLGGRGPFTCLRNCQRGARTTRLWRR